MPVDPTSGRAAWSGPRRQRGLRYQDFTPDQRFDHHWGRTLSETDNLLFTTLTLHYNPIYFNVEVARAAGYQRIPMNPLLVLGTAVSLSVEDLSEQSEAFLGIDDVTFLRPLYPGDTLNVRSTVIEKRESRSRPGYGVVSWRTEGRDQREDPVVTFRRANLFRTDPLDDGAPTDRSGSRVSVAGGEEETVLVRGRLAFDDLSPGQRLRHGRGKTVTEMDNVLLSNLMMNTSDGHFNQHAASQTSFGERMVFGGITAALVIGLTTGETGESALREQGLDGMRFLRPVLHGDTLYAASEVLEVTDDPESDGGQVTFHHWGVNQRDELVFECDRRVLIAKGRDRDEP